MRKLLAVIILVLTAGCASTGENSQLTESLFVKYATAKVIANNPDKAVAVLDLVEQAKQYVDSDTGTVSIAALDQAARDRIPWDRLDAADQMLVDAVLVEARQRLEQAIGDGILDADQRVRLSRVLGWIEQAAALAQ